MNALQYKIVKSAVAADADPIKFAKMCNAEPMDFIKVQTTNSFAQYKEDDIDLDEALKNSIFGKGR